MSVTGNETCRAAYERYSAGDLAAATRICQEIIAREPRRAEAVYLLGVIAQDTGQIEQARQSFERAAMLAPSDAIIQNTLGELYLNLGLRSEARSRFEQSLACNPTYARAHNSLGRFLHIEGDFAAAQARFAEAVRLNPRYAIAYNNLGAVLRAQHDVAGAGESFRQALAIRPDYPEAHFNLGTILQALGDPVAAAHQFREAIRLRPDYVRAQFHLGQVLEQQRRDFGALECYESAVQLDPGNAEIHRRLGGLLMLKRDWPAALAALETAVRLMPDHDESFARLVWCRQLVCDWTSYESDIERLWADAHQRIEAGEATAVVPFQALTLPWSRSQLQAVAKSHCQTLVHHQQEHGQQVPFSRPTNRGERLRVGYLSGDFYDHPISHLLHGFFGRHDRSRFEVFAYSFGPPDESVYRQRIVSECEHFVEVRDLSIPSLASRIADDGVQILVDLMGHTGVNRLGALALRPAPIQVSFLGMLGTMGASFIDYLVTDRIVTPPEFAPSFSEQFATLPDSYLIAELQPARPAGQVDRTAYGLPLHGFVYCSFNSSYKIEPRTFGVWMRLLSQVPNSVLWLTSSGAICEENLRRAAVAQGIAAERLIFAPFLPRSEHLQRHAAADLFLDTLLYNAAATASLSLQMGLPVLTCLGDTFASRVGASLLSAVGLSELIAPDVAEYERLAVDLAQRPQRLRQWRTELKSRSSIAPLFDTARFVANLQRAYLVMWESHAKDRPPRPIAISPAMPRSN